MPHAGVRRRSLVLTAGLFALALLLVAGGALPAAADPGTTERVSVDSASNQGNGHSWLPSISTDGRYVAFTSWASNLVPDDINGVRDVFVHDRQTGTTERVSVDSAGNEGNARSGEVWASISNDGRYVAFASMASNLVPADTNDNLDIFVHDRQTGITERVSVDSVGNEANAGSMLPSISSVGRFVAFSSYASNLVPNDTNATSDVFVHDRQTGITERVSVDSAGNEADSGSGYVPPWMGVQTMLSADGRVVVFASMASNLVPGDTNGVVDVFVHDRQTGTTERVSVDSAGNQGEDHDSGWPSISADGRYVAFGSLASNLVPGDTNGAGDIFMHDRQTGITERVSLDAAGNQGSGGSLEAAISGDARYVAFTSEASNLVPGDTNGAGDIFVHDRQTGITERVSLDSAGSEGNSYSFSPSTSGDARYVAFTSEASNLVPGDTNGYRDVFVHDRGPMPVGGIAQYPDVAQIPASSADSSGPSARNYAALAGGVAAALVALTAGAWYVRRRRLG